MNIRELAQKCIFLIISFLVIFTHTNAFSEERVVSLNEAITIALMDNPELKGKRSAALAVHDDVGIARSFILPRIVFEERFMRTSNPAYAFSEKMNQGRFSTADLAGAPDTFNNPGYINDFQSSLSFEQAIFAPKAYIGLKMAATNSAAKNAEVERTKEYTAFHVLKLYLGVQTAREFLSAASKNVEDAKEHLRISEARSGSGLGLYSDVLRAKVAVLDAEERVISAQKALNVAKRMLGLILGINGPLDVSEDRPALIIKDQDYYYLSVRMRYDIKAMEERQRNAENALKMADSGYLPVIGIGGAYQMNDHKSPLECEGKSWQLTAFLRWELFDGAKRENERQKAKHLIEEAAAYLDGARKQAEFSVYEAMLGIDEARKGRELASSALDAAEEGRRLVRVRYENSLATISDLLDVQTNLASARARVVEKESAYLTSVANLAYQSGTLLNELGIKE